MPAIRFRIPLEDDARRSEFEALVREFDLPLEHGEDVVAEAAAAVSRGPTLPPGASASWVDRTDLELIAIDPAGSIDLDQAFGAERTATGFRIFYAIADLAAFITPGGAVEAAALDRGVTLYLPHTRFSLHPNIINEDAASLLPGQTRPALLWTIDIDREGEIEHASVRRALVNIAEALSYEQANLELVDASRECLIHLRDIGRLRLERERARGAVSLRLPAQEIRQDADGHAHLVFDESLPIELWNAQISLLTGIAAAHLMVEAGVGMLRTLPPINGETVTALHRTAAHLGVEWPMSVTYAERVRSLDPSVPTEAALLMRSARGLRGAGYAAFASAAEIPEEPMHSAIASIYAHVTAPLRRVCDRYTNEILLAICADTEAPEWALARLPDLPAVMGKTRQREGKLERAIIDHMESLILAPLVGEVFDAVVINPRREQAVIQLRDPAVIATLNPKRPLGEVLKVRLTGVDKASRTTTFERVVEE